MDDIILGRKAIKEDLSEIVNLYEKVCDSFIGKENYCGWARDLYPTKQTAIDWLTNDVLHVLTYNNQIVSTAALTKDVVAGYKKIEWLTDYDYDEIFVIKTVATHPNYLRCGYSKMIIDYAINFAKNNEVKSLRLDVSDYNSPAITLYESIGFQLVAKANLFDYPFPHDIYRLYEYII